MKRKDYLALLEGQEFLSLTFEGYIMVHNSELWRNGKVLLPYINLATLKQLFSDLCKSEGI